MGHARPPVGLINRDQDAGAAPCEKYVLQPPTLLARGGREVVPESGRRRRKKKTHNVILLRHGGKNIRSDSFRPERAERYWR